MLWAIGTHGWLRVRLRVHLLRRRQSAILIGVVGLQRLHGGRRLLHGLRYRWKLMLDVRVSQF